MIQTRKVLEQILGGLLALMALTYLGDFLSVRIRMMHAKPGDPFETITAYRILAIGEKGNKTEYNIDPIQPQQTGECVHALFPQHGDPPCWYLKRKFDKPIPMSLWLTPTNRR